MLGCVTLPEVLGVMCWGVRPYLECFIEADDVGVAELTQYSGLAVQMFLLVILLELASVDDLDSHLYHTQHSGQTS